jgi:RNA polymerase sigma-70 factor (ECF subfamily)
VPESTDTKFGVDLVARIRNGDAGAEKELVDRYSRAVSILLRRSTGARMEADDLFQETFRIAIEKIRAGEVRQPERISGFICSLANNLLSDHLRRGSRRAMAEPIETAVACGSPSPLDRVLRKENANLVRKVLDELQLDRDRQILYRFYIAEEAKPEICREFNLSSLQFDQILFRARQRYRALYEKAIQKK